MSIEKVKEYLQHIGAEEEVIELSASSATVELAAQALGCEPKRIAKTLSFLGSEGPILIVMAGDAKVDNKKYREYFGIKGKMIPSEQVEDLVGHPPGGVCPFGVNQGVRVYLDGSLKRFETVYPAAGSGNSCIQLTLPKLQHYAQAIDWIDIAK